MPARRRREAENRGQEHKLLVVQFQHVRQPQGGFDQLRRVEMLTNVDVEYTQRPRRRGGHETADAGARRLSPLRKAAETYGLDAPGKFQQAFIGLISDPTRRLRGW